MCYERRDPEQAKACFERDQRKDDYISRKALLEDIENTLVFSGRPDHQNQKQMGARLVVQRIRCAPAADVVPVTRCKDCDKSEPSNVWDGWIFCRANKVHQKGDNFCSFGERKDGDNA